MLSLLHGDSLDLLKELPDNAVDSVVTDPPYGLSKEPDMVEVLTKWMAGEDYEHRGGGFMGKSWDSFVPGPSLWREVFRVLKPGGYILCFAGTRTADLMGISLRLAGFERRDGLMWVYGQGFPKSHNVSKAIAKKRGKSDEARQWEGWGTALKPAQEPILMYRKPLDGTIASNVLEHGTGAINIDGCRVGDETLPAQTRGKPDPRWRTAVEGGVTPERTGRWPANIIFDPDAAAELDRQSGESKSGAAGKRGASGFVDGYESGDYTVPYGDSGGASRFFYVAKPSKKERNAGLGEFEVKRPDTRSKTGMGTFDVKGVQPQQNAHPTVKPIQLMRYLVRLVTPPRGTVLDPFVGSGTTGCAAALEGVGFIGMDQDADYLKIAKARIFYWQDEKRDQDKQEQGQPEPPQPTLF